jgi:hypothetical protein
MSPDSQAQDAHHSPTQNDGTRPSSSGLISVCVVAGHHQRAADPLQLARARCLSDGGVQRGATAAGCQGAYLKGGQPIEVKVDTFPFQRYGTLKASLVWTSPDAEDKNAASRDTDTRAGSGSRAPE